MNATAVSSDHLTTEMIDAGLEVLWAYDRDGDSSVETVIEIFKAMTEAESAPRVHEKPELPPQIAAWIDEEVARYKATLTASAKQFPFIAAMVENGSSFSAIARELGISPPTATRIFRLGKDRGWVGWA